MSSFDLQLRASIKKSFFNYLFLYFLRFYPFSLTMSLEQLLHHTLQSCLLHGTAVAPLSMRLWFTDSWNSEKSDTEPHRLGGKHSFLCVAIKDVHPQRLFVQPHKNIPYTQAQMRPDVRSLCNAFLKASRLK